jgi:DNA (cytosine-5)-methyltransferase 1
VISNPFLNSLKIGEFFCGPGGMALGARKAAAALGIPRVDNEWAFDHDPWACATYSRNLLGGRLMAPIDVADVDVRRLSPVDLFLFGFPCNDFSMVGKSRGLDGRFGPLYRHGVRYIDRHRPLAFVAENVAGLRDSRAGAAAPLEVIVRALRDAGGGYDVVPHLYRLERYGVPQTRHRVFIVGVRRDLGITFRPPAPTHPLHAISCQEAMEEPPIAPGTANHAERRLTPAVVARLAHIRRGENIWQAQELGRIPTELRIKATGAAMSQIYRRLDPTLPSYTVTGSGGGGTYVYHWDEPRMLTNRERARLQTFPDDFAFEGRTAAVRRQIGMAVPPRAAALIIGALLEDLTGSRRRTDRCDPNLNIDGTTALGSAVMEAAA